MQKDPVILFVCEHGAAKSILAAAHFNRLAGQLGLNLRAIARGTNPDRELGAQAVQGLSEDGLSPAEPAPQKLTQEELDSAQHVVTFCELPAEYRGITGVERWDDVPSVNENYKQARDVIIDHIRRMLSY